MYFIKSVELHDKNDFIVYYSTKDYNTSAYRITTVKGEELKDWYDELNEKAWPTYDEMANDKTGIYMYINKYLTYMTELYQEEKYYGEEWYMRRNEEQDFEICPYDALRDSEQQDI